MRAGLQQVLLAQGVKVLGLPEGEGEALEPGHVAGHPVGEGEALPGGADIVEGEGEALSGSIPPVEGEGEALPAGVDLAEGEGEALELGADIVEGEGEALTIPEGIAEGEGEALPAGADLAEGEGEALEPGADIVEGEGEALAAVTGEWVTTYGPKTFNNDSGQLGSNFNYVVRLPASELSEDGSEIRLTLQGPSSGQASIQAMYVGHAAGSGDSYDFDGNQVQVTVGGNGSFNLGSGTSLTDEVPFSFDSTKPLLVAYELISGDKYRQLEAAGAGFALYFKSGGGDASTTNKSGYSTSSVDTATVKQIEVFQL